MQDAGNSVSGGCMAPQMLLLMWVAVIERGGSQALKRSPSPKRAKEEQVRTSRVAMAISVVLLTLLGSAGTALAQQMIGGVIQCQSIPCVGTGDHQVLFERVGDGVSDRMIAQGGHDHLDARAYTNDRDVAKGGGGHDLLRVNDEDAMDGAIGGAGNDLCVVDASIEASDSCEGVIYR